jgi:hypothetical protein
MESRIVGRQRPTRHRQPRDPYARVGTRSLFMTGCRGTAFGENQQVLPTPCPFFSVVSNRVLPAEPIALIAYHCIISWRFSVLSTNATFLIRFSPPTMRSSWSPSTLPKAAAYPPTTLRFARRVRSLGCYGLGKEGDSMGQPLSWADSIPFPEL